MFLKEYNYFQLAYLVYILLFPCEMIVKKILPAFRAYLVKKLHDDYNMKQNDIAKCLGITQPSVSLYLSGERGSFDEIFESDKVKNNINQLDNMAKKLKEEDISEMDLMKDLCHLCSSLRRAEAYCEIHKKLDKDREAPCGLCEICFEGKK